MRETIKGGEGAGCERVKKEVEREVEKKGRE